LAIHICRGSLNHIRAHANGQESSYEEHCVERQPAE
jgi:hypothetical protein